MSQNEQQCVFVLGPESSGSRLIARVCAQVLGICRFEQWDGVGACDQGLHKVVHRSLPYGQPPQFPHLDSILAEHAHCAIQFVLTTRDITLSEFSRVTRHRNSLAEVRLHSAQAQEVMCEIIDSGQDYLVWSYESFMFLGAAYLRHLYNFLGVDSDFVPPLVDANRVRLAKPGVHATLWLPAMAASGWRMCKRNLPRIRARVRSP